MKLNIQLFGLDQYISNSDGEEVYLRKANQIQGFFEEKGLAENCKQILVPKKVMLELISNIKAVLAQHELAEELLPATPGFFYGSYEYDDWYFEQLEEVLPELEALIKPNAKYYYYCWY